MIGELSHVAVWAEHKRTVTSDLIAERALSYRKLRIKESEAAHSQRVDLEVALFSRSTFTLATVF